MASRPLVSTTAAWPAVHAEVRRFVVQENTRTTWLMWLARLLLAVAAAAAVVFARQARRCDSRKRLAMWIVMSVLLLLTAGWMYQLGFRWAPHELKQLKALGRQ